MRLVLSWLREFVDLDASAEDVASRIGLRGFEVAAVEILDGGDGVIDFEVTANRPDCLSVIGLAREVATAFDRPMRVPSAKAASTIALAAIPVGDSPRLRVTIDDAELCPRYAALVADVSPQAKSPDWMTKRLHAAGVRPISPIVDITNYVLLELGQPTHAFDLQTLAGSEIRVRRARTGEVLRTLDGVERKLDADMLVIADRDRAQAVAGVMGGADSEISASTRTVAFESAYFTPTSVRRTSRKLGLKTEASARFERGADPNGAAVALQRIAALLAQTGAGAIVAPVIDVYPAPRQPERVHMRERRMNALLGVSVPPEDVERILTHLGMTAARTADGWDVVAPTFRVDVRREVDVIEEAGRHYGFDKLPATFPVVAAPAPAPDPRIPRDELVRRVLTASGLSEAVTFGIVERASAERFGSGTPIAISNPLNDRFDTLRPSLIGGVVDSVSHNRRHGRDGVALFEIGTRFSPAGETRAVAMAWTGPVGRVHWSAPARAVDLYDASGAVQLLCDALGVAVEFEPAAEPFLIAGQAARVMLKRSAKASGERCVGVVGQLTAAAAVACELPRQDRVFVAELDLDALAAAKPPIDESSRPLPRYPFVVRDLSIVVPDALPAAIIRGTIQAASRGVPAPLLGVDVFDRYQGKGVPEGSISLSLRLTFQADDRTLTDAEVQESFDAIVAALAREHGAKQR
ncbi:MAG TPA: phenylalanine--tRNA ligase subunit beta [Vicinamibacterales bacterium]|nr:phenylalanine--tRNA ligase subunit beta [Vicinamibacterales bacterium]